jgi:hypothetical protein
MTAEIPKFTIDHGPEVDIEATAEEILNKGHAFHALRIYEDAYYKRAVEVPEVLDLGFQTPIVGRGKNNTVESALVRACYTFDQAQRSGIHYYDIAEGVIGDIDPPLVGNSQFDHIFDHDTELWVSKENDEIIAGLSSDQIKSKKPFQATAPDALTAIESLVRMYHFHRQSAPEIVDLPLTLFR